MLGRVIEIILAVLWFYGTFFSPFSKTDGIFASAFIYGIVFLLPIGIIEIVKKKKKSGQQDNSFNQETTDNPQPKQQSPVQKESIKPKYTKEQKFSKGMWRFLQIFSLFIVAIVGFTYVYSQGWIDQLQSDENIKVSRINAFSEEKYEIVTGEEITFELTALPSRLTSDKLVVKSSDNTILEVKNTTYTDNGNRTAISIICVANNEGETSVTVSDIEGNKSVSTVVSVQKAPLVSSFSKFEDNNVLMALGTTQSISIIATAFELVDGDIYVKTPEGANVSVDNLKMEIVKDNKYKISFNVVGNTTGWSELRVSATDEKTVSEKIKVTVVEEWMLRTVWVNYSGDKYHYSRSCAGDSATEITLYEASSYKEPCSKCAK